MPAASAYAAAPADIEMGPYKAATFTDPTICSDEYKLHRNGVIEGGGSYIDRLADQINLYHYHGEVVEATCGWGMTMTTVTLMWINDDRVHNSNQAQLKCQYRTWNHITSPPEQVETTIITDSTVRSISDLQAGNLPGSCPATKFLAQDIGISWMTGQTSSGTLAAPNVWGCDSMACGNPFCYGALNDGAVRLPVGGALFVLLLGALSM
jgi:hypothetical protein